MSQINRLAAAPSACGENETNYLQLRLALPLRETCPVCRTDFERITGRRGRPLRFCSDTCRRNEQRRQQIAWERRRALRRAGAT